MAGIFLSKLKSPVGELTIAATDAAVVGICFEQPESARRMTSYLSKYYGEVFIEGENSLIRQAKQELNDYFSKKRVALSFPIEYKGTPFQQSVWGSLVSVRYGETVTYSELAQLSGHSGAPRAAGAACGANPLAIVIPCHRAVGSNSSLTKFGGGLDAKKTLLELEGHNVECGRIAILNKKA